ncbi:hypothetical protein FKW77_001067 [Venturia effusa]|uniref:phosphoinositide 5-phosphatase n=1 Tax=Venturia effusa TaxID=50376 RepID=A0A517KVS5_9PEZI|nr:hypothetical protein FKW77_001067 [Venturia effusa]
MSGSIEILIKEYPQRSFALRTPTHVLVLRHTSSSTEISDTGVQASHHASSTPQCMVEFTTVESADLDGYRSLRGVGMTGKVHGTLGLITLNRDVFLCVVTAVTPRSITIRPGETIRRIEAVEFHCLNSSAYDRFLHEQVEYIDDEGFEVPIETEVHPCLSLKKLFGKKSFYYSSDFDLTRRLQKRITDDEPTIAFESFDAGFLWNSYMIQPLINFRSRLSQREKDALDDSRIITSAIRGFCAESIMTASSSPLQRTNSGIPARLTIISRLSCRKAGTRYNARGIDDEGNVANYVETETILWSPTGEVTGECFSYVQVRGSLPVFWEQDAASIKSINLIAALQTPAVKITRSTDATQPAFDRHFENLDHSYGSVHVVNLLSSDYKKPGEIELTQRYEDHIARSPLNRTEDDAELDHRLLQYTHYDFHAETRGQNMGNAVGIFDYVDASARSFNFLYAEDREENVERPGSGTSSAVRKANPIIQQEGVFRTNCLDCLDRTNYIQTLLSRQALGSFLKAHGAQGPADFWARHSTLWADNGDALSQMYAGTGALNTSVTRHGKTSLGSLFSDVRKSATRLYTNQFLDKDRQNTIDVLLGRLVGQKAVHLHDPINDWVQSELGKRAPEYTSTKSIHIQVGTFNLNGKTHGLGEDLSCWLCPPVDPSQRFPEIVAIGLQEIVELSPQTVMSEPGPLRRNQWAAAVRSTLNENAAQHGGEEYVEMRSGQLVGAALLILVKQSVLPSIKNIEGAIKKTGMSGMAGNKGAVAIRMDFANTSLCFVTAHLAAGFSNYEERNRDYRTIAEDLRFQRNRSINDHDSVIWFGDFNYRIGLGNEKVRAYIDRGDLDTLFDNDQLYIQRTRSNIHNVFDHYDEAKITFLPTYKFDLGSDTYDTSDKGRIPAWTDRVLRKGSNLRQINYNSAPLRFSDHRPVYATFQCDVSMVDEAYRDRLNLELYEKRTALVGDRTASANVEPSDDEDLLGAETVPAAKPDMTRWWLNGGLPGQTTVRPPGKGFAVNPKRDANPFVPSDEPEWVKVDDAGSLDESRSPAVLPSHERRQILPPPSGLASGQTPQLPPRRSTMEFAPSQPSTRPVSSASYVSRSPSTASISSMPARKPAPAVPKKPSILSSQVTGENTESRKSSVMPIKSPGPPSLPPPRRSMASSGASALGRNGSDPTLMPQGAIEEAADRPMLPPRRGTGLSQASSRNLLDEKDEESLNGWEVLKPG